MKILRLVLYERRAQDAASPYGVVFTEDHEAPVAALVPTGAEVSYDELIQVSTLPPDFPLDHNLITE